MIGRWAEWVVRRRGWVIAACAVLTAVAIVGMRRLYFSNRMVEWLPKDDAQIARHVEVSENFSVNNMVLILVRPRGGVFRADLLAKVKELTGRLKETRGISMVTSMDNAADIRRIPGGIEVTNLLDAVPTDAAGLAALREKVLGKEVFRDRIVSADGEWLALAAYLETGIDQIRVVADSLVPETRRILGQEGECFFTGFPADTYFINRFVGRDLATLVPAALLLILAILFFSFRSWHGIVFPMLVVVLSTVWLFGLIGFLGEPLTIISPVLPVVIIALGSAYGIHVLNRLILQLGEAGGRGRSESIILGLRLIFAPLVLAALTDVLGFLSFKSVRLSLFADFGLFTALGLLAAMVIALALVPALASFSDFSRLQKERETQSLHRLLARWGGFTVRRRRLLLTLSLVVFGACVVATTRLRLEVSFAKFYPPSSLPRRSLEAANAHFAGAYPLAIAIEADRVRTPETLRVMRRLQNFMHSLPGTSQPFAVTDFVQELNWQLNGRYAIPDREAAVGNLWLFVEGRDELRQLLTADDRQAVLVSKVANPLTGFNSALYREIKSFLDAELGNGYASYERQALAPPLQRQLFAAQADFLSQEIFWLARRYAPGRGDRAAIATVLRAGPVRALPFPVIRERALALLGEYVSAPDFEFELTKPQQRRFLSSLMAALENGAGAEELERLMPHWLPAGVYDAQTARDLAAALCYKVEEIEQRAREDDAWQRLAPLFASTDLDFEKKVRSVLCDLTAGIAVLPFRSAPSGPAAAEGLPAGKRVALRRIDQTGYPLMMGKMERFLFASLLQSIALAYAVTLVLMTLMRRSLALGLICTLPVVFTSVVMFGLLALIGVPLDYATMMIGGVSIGVGIDYAIHFIHGYISERDGGRGAEAAIRAAFLDKGKAILANALSVMAGFAVLLLSSLIPLRNFAWAMVCSMFLAALAALTLLPASLLAFDPKIRNRRRKT